MKKIVNAGLTLILILIATLAIRVYVVEARVVPTESMTPTVRPGDRVLVDRLLYRLVPPRRGDIIVFEPPSEAHQLSILGSDYLKRVVGTPGDRLAIHGGEVIVNNQQLPEPYVASDWAGDYDLTVPLNGYFVMGDNRANSYDSRYWGAVPAPVVKGRAIAIYWPLRHAQWFVSGSEVAVDGLALALILAITLKLSAWIESVVEPTAAVDPDSDPA